MGERGGNPTPGVARVDPGEPGAFVDVGVARWCHGLDRVTYPGMTIAYLAALAGDLAVGQEDRMHVLASWLVLRDGGLEAFELTTPFEPRDWQGRRVYLQLTPAWDAAAWLLEVPSGATGAENQPAGGRGVSTTSS